MSTLTGKDLNLVKPALTDDHKVTIGTDLPANFQKIDDEFSTHLADKVTDEGGVHGLEMVTGTWTPAVTASTTDPTVTYTVRRATYVKIGKLCKCTFFMRFTCTGGEGYIQISGFPFVVKNADENGVLSLSSVGTTALNYKGMRSDSPNLTKLSVYKDSRAVALISEINNGSSIDLSGSIVYDI